MHGMVSETILLDTASGVAVGAVLGIMGSILVVSVVAICWRIHHHQSLNRGWSASLGYHGAQHESPSLAHYPQVQVPYCTGYRAAQHESPSVARYPQEQVPYCTGYRAAQHQSPSVARYPQEQLPYWTDSQLADNLNVGELVGRSSRLHDFASVGERVSEADNEAKSPTIENIDWVGPMSSQNRASAAKRNRRCEPPQREAVEQYVDGLSPGTSALAKSKRVRRSTPVEAKVRPAKPRPAADSRRRRAERDSVHERVALDAKRERNLLRKERERADKIQEVLKRKNEDLDTKRELLRNERERVGKTQAVLKKMNDDLDRMIAGSHREGGRTCC